ncbi:MAG TPA: hypothetical protein VEK79_08805 [Thermoanaerobaculia bacterium]|nr:hypothetical protein [Thermoanaerobaculia bacterium]
MMIEWAIASLTLAEMQASSVSASDQERAVRILITASSESVGNPEGYLGPAQTLHRIASYFRRKHLHCPAARTLTTAREQLSADLAATDSPILRQAFHDLLERIDSELKASPCRPASR